MPAYGSVEPVVSIPKYKGRFSITNLDLNAVNVDPGGYENPAFTGDCGSVPPSPAPSILSMSNPVVPPKNRKSSIIFPSYLRRNNVNNDIDNLSTLQTESTNNLQVYTTINHESIPRMENYYRELGIRSTRPTIDELHEPMKYDVS